MRKTQGAGAVFRGAAPKDGSLRIPLFPALDRLHARGFEP